MLAIQSSDRFVATEQALNCPICGRRSAQFVCRSSDRQFRTSPQQFSYSRCRGCASVYQSLRPVEAEIGDFYPAQYGPYQAVPVRWDAPSGLAGPHDVWPSGFAQRCAGVVQRILARLGEIVRRRFPDPLPGMLAELYTAARGTRPTLLDFGCGSPAFLDQARATGWRTIGVDFHPEVVAAVRRCGHEAHRTGDWLAAVPEQSVDVVRLNHVVEHLYEPLQTLRQLWSRLRPGGRLHLATPNAESWTFRLFRGRWFSLDAPRHIVLFSPRSLRGLLRRAGFRQVRCYHEVLTKDAARSLGYWLEDRGRIDPGGAVALMHRSDLAEALFAVARLAALAGAADRFHVIARK